MGQVSHRTRRSATKTAARIALALGTLAFVGVALHFGYAAHESAGCYQASTDIFTGEPQREVPIESEECRLILSHNEEHQRVDAAIAMLAIVIVSGAAVRLSSASRRTRRIVLMVEVVVVALGIVYTILLASVLR
jgi:hypothetical protein